MLANFQGNVLKQILNVINENEELFQVFNEIKCDEIHKTLLIKLGKRVNKKIKITD